MTYLVVYFRVDVLFPQESVRLDLMDLESDKTDVNPSTEVIPTYYTFKRATTWYTLRDQSIYIQTNMCLFGILKSECGWKEKEKFK